MWKTKVLLSCFVVAQCQVGLAATYNQPSEAELWFQRTDAGKAGYIDGLCDAFKYNSPEGELFCKPMDPKDRGPQVNRFCSARWDFKVTEGDPIAGIKIFNQFYADKHHSELPTWTVLAAYNDKACGESRVLPRLSAIQAKLLCLRQLLNMRMDKYSASVIAAQEATCNAMK